MAADGYGVTAEGFRRKRLPEIQADIFARLDDKFGQPAARAANSVTGLIVGIFAAEIDRQWQNQEDVYNAMYPSAANGAQLDNAAGFTGVLRVKEENTVFYPVCYGAPNTYLARGSQIEGADGEQYELAASGLISAVNCVSIFLSVPYAAPGMVFSLTIDGYTASHTADEDTPADVLGAMAAALPAGWQGIITEDALEVKKTDRQYGSSVAASTTFSVFRAGSPLKFAAVKTGAIEPPLLSVDKIITQTAGWESVLNEAPAYPGRERETDTELRRTYARRVSVLGTAMIEAVEARLYEEVDGVLTARVYENPSDAADADGRPPHSIEAVVEGGDPMTIGGVIWRCKAAGIDTFGKESVTVRDSQGISHSIFFNRPQAAPVFVRAVLSKNPEEDFPGDTAAETARVILSSGAALPVGADVIRQRFFGPIYRGTLGIGGIDLTLSTDGVNFSRENISVSVRQKAAFDLARISVVIAQ